MRGIVPALAIVMCCGTLYAQQPVSTIQTEGVASVDTLPTYVEFHLRRTGEGETVGDAVETARELEASLNREVEAMQLDPGRMTFSGVAVVSIRPPKARISATLRFNATPFSTSAEGPRDFAVLCDRMAETVDPLPERRGPW